MVYSIRKDIFAPGTGGELGTFQFGTYRLVLLAADGNGKPAARKPAAKKAK